MNYEYEMSYALPDSVEGLLQRGRGLGVVRALRAPRESAAFVYDGIRRDWLWDQSDERSVYLARLVCDLDLSPMPVVNMLAGDEEACLRACGVLELLALAGSVEAKDGLRAYVRKGEHWVRVLERMSVGWPPEWWEDLGDVARVRMSAEAQLPWHSEPWTRFGIAVQSQPLVPRPSLNGLSTAELLRLLSGSHTGDHTKIDALRALNARKPAEELIPLVPWLGMSNGLRPLPMLGRAVRRLGTLAVPAAHGWAQAERPWLALLGTEILADHPGPEALPGLVNELAEQWAAQDWCGPGQTARRLARFGPDAAGAVPYLRRFWLHTPHSYERTAYLQALAAISGDDGLEHIYTESLWDCQKTTRLLGITSAPTIPETLDRLAVLRDDPMETTEVRAAAGTRLAAPDGRLS
ncbi:hypothetical protein AB0K64_05285 [Streptomyces sp. NPDC053741]|uniref:hypothetical protein n=2 Tax=Streptomyces TaxID=1883 RepID=UPI0004BE3732|nr:MULTISPECIES: hypothetical protein [Streptomyces]MDF6066686.1 hypothetical protein [Streptomyces sp. JH010]MDX2622576.1 hypothetical protein [Streptomyces sp. WI03-5b]MEE1774934.1 hypothetical protein [Streptomyces sp. JV181]MYT61661.1 hypothetical protein [Streptomyces sp. SID7834]